MSVGDKFLSNSILFFIKYAEVINILAATTKEVNNASANGMPTPAPLDIIL